MAKWIVNISGGSYANPWDDEFEVEAKDFYEALKKAEKKIGTETDAEIDGITREY